MSNSESPAGPTGGPVSLPNLDELPDRLRVHALARLLGRSSRDVLDALARLGVTARSVATSIDRDVARKVAAVLVPELSTPPASKAAEPATPEPPGQPPQPSSAPAPPRESALTPVFAPPAPVFQPPVPVTPSDETESSGETGEDAVSDDVEAVEQPETEGGTRRRRRRGRRGRGRGRGAETEAATEPAGVTEPGDDTAADPTDVPGEEPQTGSTTDDAGNGEQPAESSGAEAETETGTEVEVSGTRRRRRRRRRRINGEEIAVTETESGSVAAKPRPASEDTNGDGVQSVRGSTRLEAKRQRRRDGRDAGRRRVPILTEAEFLARRESVERTMVVREHGDRVEIAVLEDGVLVEHFVTSTNGNGPAGSMIGNIYLGRVQNVLPSMEAAFVDIGRGRNAVLYAGEVDWDAAGLGGKNRRIEQALNPGDMILVQVTKDPIGHKGARLTTQISLAGRFLVYVPSGGAAGISRKLPDVERKRLKDMLKEIVPPEAGVIIRTASEGVSQEALERDVRRLQAQWEVIENKAEQAKQAGKAPVLVYEEPDLLIKVVRDLFNEDFSRLVVEGDSAWEMVSNYVAHVAPELVDRLHRHVGPTDVFAEYRIDEQLVKALDRKVWLPSGGTLVIDRTEAMTVIDVNTGKFTGSGGNLEETVTRTNLEAAEEIVRQLRLRDIGGIIVIDFIDMVLEANRDLVLRRLIECLARDRTRHQVAEVTSLGLVQMTRKRVGGGLLEHFSTPCEHCRGRGIIVSTDRIMDRRGDNGRGDNGRRARTSRARRAEEPVRAEVASAPEPEAERSGQPAPASTEAPTTPAPAADVPARVEVPRPAPAAETVSAGAETSPPQPATTEDSRPAAERSSTQIVISGLHRRRIRNATRAKARSEGETTGTNGAEPPATEHTAPAEPVPNAEVRTDQSAAAQLANGHVATSDDTPAPRRRRVTRVGGAPTVTGGAGPVAAVVTVPASRTSTPPQEDLGTSLVPPQPEPGTGLLRRRVRRVASRPAGPPGDGAASQD